MIYGQEDSFKDYIDTILKNIAKLQPIDAQIVLRKLYETHFGIFNHMEEEAKETITRPMASVALYDMEENGQGSPLYRRISQYIRNGIEKHTGLNLIEFLSLPREMIQFIYAECEKQSKTEVQGMEALQRDLNRMKS